MGARIQHRYQIQLIMNTPLCPIRSFPFWLYVIYPGITASSSLNTGCTAMLSPLHRIVGVLLAIFFLLPTSIFVVSRSPFDSSVHLPHFAHPQFTFNALPIPDLMSDSALAYHQFFSVQHPAVSLGIRWCDVQEYRYVLFVDSGCPLCGCRDRKTIKSHFALTDSDPVLRDIPEGKHGVAFRMSPSTPKEFACMLTATKQSVHTGYRTGANFA